MKRKDIPALIAKTMPELLKDIAVLEKEIAMSRMDRPGEKKATHELSDRRRTLAIMKSALRAQQIAS